MQKTSKIKRSLYRKPQKQGDVYDGLRLRTAPFGKINPTEEPKTIPSDSSRFHTPS
ncbi:hypothetical protein [Nostoc sp.]|uniref:hypothetical protein n=1 Tax=Nostoc sp. TaxID=1180 RepID=UPI002FEF5C7B